MAFTEFERFHCFAHMLVVELSRHGFQFPKVGDAKELSSGFGHGLFFVLEVSKAFDLSQFVRAKIYGYTHKSDVLYAVSKYQNRPAQSRNS